LERPDLRRVLRRSTISYAVVAADLVVFPILAVRAASSIVQPSCRSLPDACAANFQTPLSATVPLVPALFVVCSELLLLGLLGFSGAPRGRPIGKWMAAVGAAFFSLFVFASSRGLKSLDQGLTPYAVYSSFTRLFVSNPARYSDATGLYYGLAVYDVEALAFLTLVLAGTFLLYRSNGVAFALTRVVRVGALFALFLSADVAVFDYGEFDIHATALQSQLQVFTWFTNADLLFAALSVAVATFLLARAPPVEIRPSPQRGPSDR
jgi:hypothetical protein